MKITSDGFSAGTRPEVVYASQWKYFDLGDLRQFLTASPHIPEEEACDIVVQLLSSLKVMHDLNITHRDVKPENIFIVEASPNWRIKVGDFGVSKRILDGTQSILQSRVGTRLYMAPEVLHFLDEDDEIGAYSRAVDVWSVGVIAFEIMAGERPFRRDMDIKKYCKNQYKLPDAALRNSGISPATIGLIPFLLDVRPERRASARSASQAWERRAEVGIFWAKVQRSTSHESSSRTRHDQQRRPAFGPASGTHAPQTVQSSSLFSQPIFAANPKLIRELQALGLTEAQLLENADFIDDYLEEHSSTPAASSTTQHSTPLSQPSMAVAPSLASAIRSNEDILNVLDPQILQELKALGISDDQLEENAEFILDYVKNKEINDTSS